ncbi:MAG: hypothetical protein DSM106950_25450 [Stigonema ocellatum SAG 48.90 = DSM 106950]|nr:hypothetical protein [Stigonema ocellatum SAG 48.90 = DSM 106950]
MQREATYRQTSLIKLILTSWGVNITVNLDERMEKLTNDRQKTALLNHGMNLHARKVKAGRAPASGVDALAACRRHLNCRAKAQRERVLKYPIFSFHTSIQQRPKNSLLLR